MILMLSDEKSMVNIAIFTIDFLIILVLRDNLKRLKSVMIDS
jgi:hypothetical protein